MQLNSLDWTIVVLSLLVGYAPALLFARRAGRGTAEFFTSGRAAPWWLIGTSMVATTFSTDTPNLVTNFVRTDGVAKNWAWWSFLLTGMVTVFFYARLWRRSGVLTDLEFYELRYSGKSAAFLRGFRAIYLGLLFNGFIMATVTLAAAKIASVMLGWDRMQTLWVCSLICVVFAVTSGLWGVLVTDMVQFVIAMVGAIAAAWFALGDARVGGLAGMLSKVPAEKLSFLPDFHNTPLLLEILIVPLAVQWWAAWYPGAEPGGGSYVAQRMLAARSERDALAGTLWFNLAHYALRPWPWIIVALCSLIVFPTLDDIRRALPHVDENLIGHDLAYPAMLSLLPHGLLGLLVAALLAAYVSTMSTHMNWGASYLVNDFYRRFVLSDRRAHPAAGDARPAAPGAPSRVAGPAAREAALSRDWPPEQVDERQLVWVSRGVTAALMIVAGAIMLVLTTAADAFALLLSIGAGTGSIYLLRWYWWRINAWSEIVAMIASFVSAVGLYAAGRMNWAIPSYVSLLVTVAVTTVAWVATMLLTRPTDEATLVRFWRLVRPAGPGWARIRRLARANAAAAPGERGASAPGEGWAKASGEGGATASGKDSASAPGDSLPQSLLGVMLGCVTVYSALFGTGSLLYGNHSGAAIFAVVFVLSGAGLAGLLRSMWRSPPPRDRA